MQASADRSFAAQPENTFREFIAAYYEECRRRVPGIEGIAGKWNFEDLIPGMSDFDTRLMVSNEFSDEDWCMMSTEVGEAHLHLCRKRPQWARILEHLPGINLTWEELGDSRTYYPEYRQWTMYRFEDADEWERCDRTLSSRPWTDTDEYYFLKKFLTYYGPYDREIDPAINLGPYESKYPLHSRFMHYFAPPVQAAMSIIEGTPLRGKLDSLRRAAKAFPNLAAFDRLFEAISRHYEIPDWYEEPMLTRIETELHEALQVLARTLSGSLTLVNGSDPATWRQDLNRVPVSMAVAFFDSTRFARLFKGRLRFYLGAPRHFEQLWCVQNELARAGQMFLRRPLAIYHEAVRGTSQNNTERLIAELPADIASAGEKKSLTKFADLTPGTWAAGAELQIAEQIAQVFDDVFRVLARIGRLVRSAAE